MKRGAVMVMCLMAVLVIAADAYTCGDFQSPLIKCGNYLTGKEPSPNLDCCAGVQKIKTLATDKATKQQACACIKDAATKMAGIKDDAASSLAGKCGTTTDIPISRNVDCSKVGLKAYTCGDFQSPLIKCTSFLTGKEPSPNPDCCAGVQKIKTMATDKATKQQACTCIKDAATKMAGIKDDAANSLAGKCGTTTDIPVSRNVDCSKVGLKAYTCGDFQSPLIKCTSFLTGKEPSPNPDCCAGVQKIKTMATDKATKKQACTCIKDAATKMAGIKDDAASSLAGKCGTTTDIPISRNVDCSKVGLKAYTCVDFQSPLIKCTSFLTGKEPSPNPDCCAGVQKIKTIATDKATKQQACACIKDAATKMAGIKDDAASSLAGKCGTTTDIPVSRNVDCSKVGLKAYTCGDFQSPLIKCTSFLTGKEPSPNPDCCAGVQKIKTMATDKATKQQACACIKDAATKMAGIKDDAANSLAGKCGTTTDIPVSRNVDCSKVG